MTEPTRDGAFAILVERVIPGATLLRHERLGGGVSAAVHELDVSSAAGVARFVVRRPGAAAWKSVRHDAARTEFELLRALHAGGLPVPRPLLLEESSELLGAPFFVMERVEGSTDIAAAALDSALARMAAFLARLHALDVETLALPRLAAREEPVQGALEYLPRRGEFDRVRESLSNYRVAAERPSLLHGDYWPGNLLWNRGELAAVLDWEDAALGARASDVACCRAELNALFGAPAASAFTARYLSLSAEPLRDLPLWDVYVASAALATLHAWGLPPEVEAQRRVRTQAFLGEAAEELVGRG